MIVERTLPDHWKVVELKRLSGRNNVIEWLIRLWGEYERRKNVPLDVNSASAIAAICRYDGDDAEEFVGWLLGLGFLEKANAGLIAHDWAKHNSQLITNWANGKYGSSGGRPKKPKETQRLANGNPLATQRPPNDAPIRLDLDKIRKEEETCARAAVGTSTVSLPDGGLGETEAVVHVPAAIPNPHSFFEKEVTKKQDDASSLIVRLSEALSSRRGCRQIANWLQRCVISARLVRGTETDELIIETKCQALKERSEIPAIATSIRMALRTIAERDVRLKFIYPSLSQQVRASIAQSE